jgi:Domain of unknown function (DU1801)
MVDLDRLARKPVMDPAVRAAFAAFPPDVRRASMHVRALIFETAAATPGVGPIEERLRWGEPAYLTSATRSGSTVRLGWHPSKRDECQVLFHCRTTLVERFRTLFPNDFRFEGQRAIVFACDASPPRDALRHCIALALTYHLHAH